MSYQSSSQNRKEKHAIHPIWRGIGCAFIVLIPLMSYAIGTLYLAPAVLKNPNMRQMFPAEMLQTITVPVLGNLTYAGLVFAFVAMIMLFAVFTIFYSILYRMVGPPKYGPTDAPPIRRKTRKSR